MKVLITGVAGFIGSNLAEFLLKKGHKVYALDNFSSSNKKTIRKLESLKNFHFYEFDLSSNKKLPESLSNIEVIIHLAAKKIPRYTNSLDTLISNTRMSRKVLELSSINHAKFIFSSTSDVYGMNNKTPFKEDSNLVLGPSTVFRWAYATSKIFDEHLSFAYQDQYKFPVVVLRFFGVYGPGVNLSWRGGPFGPFIDAIMSGRKIEIHGDGNQIRCFTYIDDVVSGIYLSMISKKADGEIFNISSNQKTTIIELVEKIEKISGKKVIKNFIPYTRFYGGRYQDVTAKIPETEKAKKLIHFEAKTKLEEGIKKTINWYLKNK